MEIDQIFVGIHVRVTRLVASLVPPVLRNLLISLSLCVSVFLLSSLIALHHLHIHPQPGHYQLASDTAGEARGGRGGGGEGSGFPLLSQWQRESDVLRVEIVPPAAEYGLLTGRGWRGWWDNTEDITITRQRRSSADTSTQQHSSSSSGDDDTAITQSAQPQQTHDPMSAWSSSVSAWWPLPFSLRPFATRAPNFSSAPTLPHRSSHPSTSSITTSSSSSVFCSGMMSAGGAAVYSSPVYQYDYAQHKGYLLLPSSLYLHHNIVITTVRLPASHRAFGPFPLSFFTYHLFGYDSLMLNHLLRQLSGGFMRSGHTGDIFTLGSKEDVKTEEEEEEQEEEETRPPPASLVLLLPAPLSRLLHLLYQLVLKTELLVTTLFLFFATTTLVSSTLTATQLRMLHFTDQLRQHLRLQLPIVGLVLEHTMQSLSFVPVVVGILFFLFEFFNSQVLAFLLLMLVWLCESFTVLFCRCEASMRYFPKLFALYFVMFAVYFFSFPYGFHSIAMALTASQLYVSICYFTFHYELPAVLHSRISIHRPRMLVLRRSEGQALTQQRDPDVRGRQPAAAGQREERRRGGREGELLAHLLGLWDRPEQHQREEEEKAEVRMQREDEREEGLEFSRWQLRSSRAPPSAPSSAVVDGDSEHRGWRRGRWAVAVASSAFPASPSAAASPSASSSSSSSPPMQQPTTSLSLLTAAASGQPDSAASSPLSQSPPSQSPPSHSLSSSASQPSSLDISSLTSASTSPVIPSLAPSPSTPRASSASSPSLPLSPSSSSSSDAHSDALHHLQSLPHLVATMIHNTQKLRALHQPPSSPLPSHRSRRRSRAASAASDGLSPQPQDSTPSSPPVRQSASHSLQPPPRPHSLVTLTPSSAFDESKEETAAAPPLPAPPPPFPPSAACESRELHRALLDQLLYVLQVSLFVLKTLAQTQPSWPGAQTAVVSPTPVDAAGAASPLSPRARSPATSPLRSSPLMQRRSGASSPTLPLPSQPRQLLLPRSLAGVLTASGASSSSSSFPLLEAVERHSQASGVRMEPISPDNPAADAPMM